MTSFAATSIQPSFIPAFPSATTPPTANVPNPPNSFRPAVPQPSGARLQPSPRDPIAHRVQNLTFGYESPNVTEPDPESNHRPPISVPSGARLEPPLLDPISHRLQNLTFGYEQPAAFFPSSRVRYRCQHGHLVSCRPGSSACKTCPSCVSQVFCPQTNRSRRKLRLCELSALAKERGGELLSTEYINSRRPLLWRCQKGHLWKANASNVRSAGSWCPECARQNKKRTLHDMNLIASERGGQCLSEEYISEHVKLKWRCAAGHEFWLAPNNVNRKPNGARKPSWCKICAKKDRRRTSQNLKQEQASFAKS